MNQEHFDLVKGSLSRRSRAASPEVQPEPTQQEIEELFDERITPETVLPPMQPLFEMFDVPCFYRGELVADCGKAKSGKTFFLSIIQAKSLTPSPSPTGEGNGPQDCTDFSCLRRTGEAPLRVLWIDTEQSQQSTQEILRDRIIPLAEQSVCDKKLSVCENLFAFNLRGLGFEKRGKMVDVAIRAIKPDIAIIDGVKDFMTDINDAVQATLIMEKLMALAKEVNCCIVCVLHQNKSEQDRNMRGSIDTELTNKAFEVFQCEVISESDTFKVTQTYSRKQRMKQKLYYRVNKQGLPELCVNYQEQPRDAQGRFASKNTAPEEAGEPVCRKDLCDLFSKAMEGRTQRPFGEVMAIALKKCGVLDAKTYYAYFAMAEEQGIIRKEVHPETGVTWVELNDNPLPF